MARARAHARLTQRGRCHAGRSRCCCSASSSRASPWPGARSDPSRHAGTPTPSMSSAFPRPLSARSRAEWHRLGRARDGTFAPRCSHRDRSRVAESISRSSPPSSSFRPLDPRRILPLSARQRRRRGRSRRGGRAQGTRRRLRRVALSRRDRVCGARRDPDDPFALGCAESFSTSAGAAPPRSAAGEPAAAALTGCVRARGRVRRHRDLPARLAAL